MPRTIGRLEEREARGPVDQHPREVRLAPANIGELRQKFGDIRREENR